MEEEKYTPKEVGVMVKNAIIFGLIVGSILTYFLMNVADIINI
jgi:hypothetical protein